MKTQINNLVKGNHRLGIDGTNSEIRNEIAAKVISENHEKMKVLLNNETVELTANWSASRKSVSYFGGISIELYRHFIGEFGLPKKKPEAYIQIFGNMNVVLVTNSRKPMYHYISEKLITII